MKHAAPHQRPAGANETATSVKPKRRTPTRAELEARRRRVAELHAQEMRDAEIALELGLKGRQGCVIVWRDRQALGLAAWPTKVGTDESIVPQAEASRRTHVARATIRRWEREELLPSYGTGVRAAKLYSIADIEALRDRAAYYSMKEAQEILKVGYQNVVDLCSSGQLPHRRLGVLWLIEKEPLELLARDRAAQRLGWVTLAEAARLTAFTTWALYRLRDDDCLTIRAGRNTGRGRREQLVRLSELEELAAEEDWHACPRCGCTAPPGLLMHFECGPGSQPPTRRCSLCEFTTVTRSPSHFVRADRENRRIFCRDCDKPFRRSLARARLAVHGADRRAPLSTRSKQAFRRVLEIGLELERDVLSRLIGSKPGAQPKIALDLTIEALFVSAEFSDEGIRQLLVAELGEGLNERYVKIRRVRASIRRRKAA